MTATTQIHKFNSRRMYTETGQGIAWQIIDTDSITGYRHVSFADASRFVDGVLRIDPNGRGEITDNAVLRAYDCGGYGYDTDRDRVAELYLAAGSVGLD